MAKLPTKMYVVHVENVGEKTTPHYAPIGLYNSMGKAKKFAKKLTEVIYDTEDLTLSQSFDILKYALPYVPHVRWTIVLHFLEAIRTKKAVFFIDGLPVFKKA